MKKFTLFLTLFFAATMTIFAQDEQLTITASPTGAVSTLWGDGDMTIEFNKAVIYTEPADGLKLTDSKGDVVRNITLNWNGAKTRAYVILDGSIEVTGEYYFTIPAGVIATADGETLPETTFTFIVENSTPEVKTPEWWSDFDWNPAVKSFEKVTISFDNLTSLKLNEGKAYLFTAAGNEEAGDAQIVEIEDKDGNKQTKIEITFNQYTEPGIYQIHIPEGLFTMNDNVNNEEKLLQFEIIAPIQVTPLEIVKVTPDAGNVEGEITSIIITYNQSVGVAWAEGWTHVLSEQINLIDAEGNKIVLTQTGNIFLPLTQIEYAYLGETPEMNDYWFYKAVPITAAGTYTLDASQIIVQYGHDPVEYTYAAQGSAEGTFTWTIAETGIENIDAETENAEIYDLTGRRVKNITNAGIYIVNGVKKVIK